MCGIAGIVKFNADSHVEEKRLRRMSDSIIHRGPDEEGIVIRPRVGLAHRRLSIIDLAAGQQPMANPNRTVWISYNGELYNADELRETLRAEGFDFRTRCDTEVLLRAYEAYGDGCVEKLRGMFAFAIWDEGRQRLFLGRDPLGIKPLYYRVTDSEIVFGSEIKAILAAFESRPVLNRAIIPEYLASRYIAGEETFFEGIRKLMPGFTLSWSVETGMVSRQYWQLPAAREDDGMTRADCVDKVRTELTDAVRRHMVSDVPVGLFLSGGMDSSALAALMAPMCDGPVPTFSVGFSERSANELAYARMAASSIGARHHETVVSPEQFFASLPSLVWHEDEPIAFTSSVPLHNLSRLASEHVKVVLTGEGADELFLGYGHRYRVTYWNKLLGDLYTGATPTALREAIARLVPSMPRRLRRYAERTFLALDTGPRELFFENFSVFRQALRTELLVDPQLQLSRDPHNEGLRHYQAAGGESLQCMSHADIKTYLVELLMKQDQMSMAASMESRVPFLDQQLVETVASLPMRHKFRGWQTKALFRDAVRDILPPAIMKRKKMGFPVPIGSWLQGRYWPLVEEFVLGARALSRHLFNPDTLNRIAREHRHGVKDHGEQLWLLINLEVWQRIFVDGEEPAMVSRNCAIIPESDFQVAGHSRATVLHV